MKLTKLIVAAAIAALGTSATADRLARNNVACSTGSVYGFTVQGDTGLTHYVQAADLGRCANAVGVPASVDIFEPTEVVAWLASVGVEITDVRLRSSGKDRSPVLDANGDAVFDANGNQEFNVSRDIGGW